MTDSSFQPSADRNVPLIRLAALGTFSPKGRRLCVRQIGIYGGCMLLKILKYCDLNERMLMDVYAESNFENTDYFFPDEENKELAVQKVEAGFLDFLKNEFFLQNEAAYWILEENGVWYSALRTCKVLNGPYYLEALETRPDFRGAGYASLLLSSVLDALRENGPFRVLSIRIEKKVNYFYEVTTSD